MQYTEKVMDHFMNPHNVGVIENPSGYGKVGNPSCGDIMEIFIKVENDIITDVKFRTFGCASAIASSSVSTDLVKGKTIEEALKLTNKKVVEELGGLPPVKMHCSVLAEEAIQMAINDYLSKKERLNFEDEIMNLDARILGSELIDIPYKDRGIVEYFIESMLYSDFAYKVKIRITKEKNMNVINKIKRILLAK